MARKNLSRFDGSLRAPMLATPASEPELRALGWPKLLSPKVDGVRALCVRSAASGRPVLVSRKLLPIPNLHTQHMFAREEYIGLDGELIVGGPTDKNLMQQTTSGVMTEDGTPNVKWLVFDRWDIDAPYFKRAQSAKSIAPYWVPQYPVRSYDEVMERESELLDLGYEGAILRDPRAPYKHGRSTLREQYLVKVKRFTDSEAVVTGYEELEHNLNEATLNELGHTKRSSHQENKVGADRLGVLIGWDKKYNWEVRASGFTLEQSLNLWKDRKYLIDLIFTYKFFPIGIKDKPRHPGFKAFRNRIDT